MGILLLESLSNETIKIFVAISLLNYYRVPEDLPVTVRLNDFTFNPLTTIVFLLLALLHILHAASCRRESVQGLYNVSNNAVDYLR